MIIPLTRIQSDELDVMTKLFNEIHRREMGGSGWNLQGNNYLKLYFNRTHAINGRTYVKTPIRSNSIKNILKNDTYCFLWSILPSIHPIDEDPQRVSNYMSYQIEPNITSIDLINAMKIIDIPRFER